MGGVKSDQVWAAKQQRANGQKNEVGGGKERGKVMGKEREQKGGQMMFEIYVEEGFCEGTRAQTQQKRSVRISTLGRQQLDI